MYLFKPFEFSVTWSHRFSFPAALAAPNAFIPKTSAHAPISIQPVLNSSLYMCRSPRHMCVFSTCFFFFFALQFSLSQHKQNDGSCIGTNGAPPRASAPHPAQITRPTEHRAVCSNQRIACPNRLRRDALDFATRVQARLRKKCHSNETLLMFGAINQLTFRPHAVNRLSGTQQTSSTQ